MSRNGKDTRGVIARLWHRVRTPMTSIQPTLLSHEQFERAIVRERARAERGHHSFAFIRLRVASEDKSKNGYNSLLTQLATVVGKRMRFTDLAGIQNEEVGVVLVNTPIWAIEDIVKDIESLFRKQIARRNGKNGEPPEIACDIFYAANERDAHTADNRKDELWPQLRT